MKLLYVIFLLVLSHFSMAQWSYQNPIPTDDALHDIHFFNENDGIIVGYSGTLLFTYDGGSTWEYNYSDELEGVTNFFFLDDNLGWAAGDNSGIFKTVDGGKNWIRLHSKNSRMSQHLNSICFVNENNGFTVGSQGEIWRSQDGGLSWTHTHSSSFPLNKVKFLSETEGWIVGNYGSINKTINGGESWDAMTGSSPTGSEHLRDIYFFDNDSICTYSQNNLYWTTSNGYYWYPKEINASGSVNRVNFVNSITATAFGSGGLIYKTTNAGTSWENQSVAIHYNESLLESFFIDNNHGVVVGSSGYIFQTDDGQTWTELSSGERFPLFKISFSNMSSGMAVGGSGQIYKTTNSGLNWQIVHSPGANMIYDFQYLTNNTCLAVGYNGYVIISFDAGFTWIQYPQTTTKQLTGLSFDSPDHGFIIGQGVIYETDNQGYTLNEVLSSPDDFFTDIHAVNSLKVFAVGYNYTNSKGFIMRTDDGGDNWQKIVETNNPYINGIFFLDELNGWVCGNEGWILSTTNGGDNWSYKNTGSGYILDIAFADTQKGWAVGTDGLILHTSDGGINWEKLSEYTFCNLKSVHLFNDSIGWICGTSGIILNMGIDQIVDIEYNTQTAHPQNNMLTNFPNPFSTTSFIDMSFETDTYVTLSVYNMNGTLIRKPERHFYTLGKQKIQLNGQSLVPGIYYYTLSYSNKVHQGKFVIIH
jgi:photosystem II stability/assembly factor-like uncharacterized protein